MNRQIKSILKLGITHPQPLDDLQAVWVFLIYPSLKGANLFFEIAGKSVWANPGAHTRI